MHLLVDALSATNASGRHVLLGHLTQLAAWTRGRHRMTVLHHAINADIVRDLGPDVKWRLCPPWTAHWRWRRVWERFLLPRLARNLAADGLFSPAGVTIPALHLPQFVLCQNPWCLVDLPRRSAAEAVKAHLQRKAYARAVTDAALLAFNSNYMREAYVQNAGFEPRAWTIAYQGLAPDTLARAVATPARNSAPAEPSIVSVSAMAPHKGVETLISAVALLHRRHRTPARLRLIGAWPDAGYRKLIERLIDAEKLRPFVSIEGHLPSSELCRAYAEARVFSLLSRCESFGIPAIEAQAFGTPVVTSACCAMPEIGGDGGLYATTGSAESAATLLAHVLGNDAAWSDLSRKALHNVSRFEMKTCSRPLLRIFETVP